MKSSVASASALNVQSVAAPAPRPAYQPQRLALTGATGSLGRQFLAAVLHEMPQTHVTAVIRASSDNFRLPSFQVLVSEFAHRLTLIDSDLRDARLTSQQRRQLVESDGGLWHFAASTNLHAASPDANQKIRDINEGGTTALLQALAGSDKPGPLHHVSTAYVCGKRTGLIRESDLVHDAGFRNTYEASKNASEQRVRAALDAGLSGAIYRPSLVVADQPGPGPAHIAEVLVNAFRAAAERRMRLTLRIPGTAAINAVDDEWVLRTLLALAPLSNKRRTYHLTARQEVTMQAFAAAAASLMDGLDLRLIPREASAEVTIADRLADRMLAPFKPYFEARVQFDRSNVEQDAPHMSAGGAIDPVGILRHRTQRLADSKIA